VCNFHTVQPATTECKWWGAANSTAGNLRRRLPTTSIRKTRYREKAGASLTYCTFQPQSCRPPSLYPPLLPALPLPPPALSPSCCPLHTWPIYYSYSIKLMQSHHLMPHPWFLASCLSTPWFLYPQLFSPRLSARLNPQPLTLEIRKLFFWFSTRDSPSPLNVHYMTRSPPIPLHLTPPPLTLQYWLHNLWLLAVWLLSPPPDFQLPTSLPLTLQYTTSISLTPQHQTRTLSNIWLSYTVDSSILLHLTSQHLTSPTADSLWLVSSGQCCCRPVLSCQLQWSNSYCWKFVSW
jgi:hypothetical protein